MSLISRCREALALEDMSKMTSTVAAYDLRPRHPKRAICVSCHCARNGVKESWPSATRFEFLLVNYPGLKSHKQHPICLKQHRDGLGGGMLSFRIKGGPQAADRFCQATNIFTLAESLGGVESLVEVPSSMTHAGIPKDQREAAGVYDDLVRISCGVEDGEDLRKDVLQALEKAVVWPKVNGKLDSVANENANGNANGTANGHA